MTNPKGAIITGYASKADAYAMWANIVGNDKLSVVGVNIGFGTLTPAEREVCWIILPTSALEPKDEGAKVAEQVTAGAFDALKNSLAGSAGPQLAGDGSRADGGPRGHSLERKGPKRYNRRREVQK